MNNTESKLISAVLEDKQIHVLLQANADNLLRTHNDIWEFIRNYFEHNNSLPPKSLVVDKFRDFSPVEGVGATKHHLQELQTEYLNDSLKDILRSTAANIQSGNGSVALEEIISKTSELKKNTSVIRDLDVTDVNSAVAYFENVKKQQELGVIGLRPECQVLTTICQQGLCQVSLAFFLHILELESLGYPLFCCSGMEAGEVPPGD
jgi:sulfur relay (sulfurtransferase) DsrC/TusE family protein